MTSSSPSSARAASPRRARSSSSWLASGLAALVLVTGCGGGGDDEHEEFAAEANAVCEQNRRRVEALPSPQSTQQLLGYVEDLTALARDQLGKLRAIQPPEDDADEYERMLTQMQATLALYPDLRDAVRSGQQVAIESVLERANSSNEQAAQAALALDLDDCVPGDGEETEKV